MGDDINILVKEFCVCVRACVHACVRACVRAYVRARARNNVVYLMHAKYFFEFTSLYM